ncbi:MAG: T9SS type A sorting domain-containing protein [Candidatus Cloacimonetes bacterium]|nr:T9SS type A sorting domain-containing protein [Candidatus Cloacimonadota bacterium]
MVKRLIILSLLLIGLVGLYAQSITLSTVSISAEDPLVRVGDEITVSYTFTPSNVMGVQGASYQSNTDKLLILWFSTDDGSGAPIRFDTYDVSSFASFNADDGVVNTNSLTFTLPTAPSSAKSLKVVSALYGTAWDYVTIVHSSAAASSSYLQLNTNQPPTATDVAILNGSIARVGDTLHGTYTYSDAEDDPQSNTTFRWLRSTSSDPYGAYLAISGATSLSYNVSSSDLNRFLKFEVKPRASSGVTEGNPVLSDFSEQIEDLATISLHSATVLTESSANDGSLNGVIVINSYNADFVSGIDPNDIIVSNLPAGLSVGSIDRINSNLISLDFAGNAEVHEASASINSSSTLKIQIAAGAFSNVSSTLSTATGPTIQYDNNGITSIAFQSCGNQIASLTWDIPAGLKATGSGLQNFDIYRGGSFVDSVPLTSYRGEYSYTDYGLNNGTAYQYYVLANYSTGDDPQSSAVTITPMAITAFSFAAESAIGVIDHNAKTISVEVPYDAELTSLIATFVVPSGVTVKVDGATQSSGNSTNDFSSAVQYDLSVTNGSNCSYTIAVAKEEGPLDIPVLSTGTTTTSSIRLEWAAIDGAASYKLQYSVTESFESSAEIDESGLSHVFSGLEANTTHYFRIKAIHSSNEEQNSAYSDAYNAATIATSAGTGSVEISTDNATIVNIGAFSPLTSPSLSVDLQSFTSGENNVLTVSISMGSDPEGLTYSLDFDNSSFLTGTYTFSYAGLGYDPSQAGYRINGGGMSIGGTVDTGNKTITINVSSKTSKGAYTLELIAGAEGQTLPVVFSSFNATAIDGGRVRITWATHSETGVQGFYILRGVTDIVSEAQIISPMISATNTSNLTTYSYTDFEISHSGIYYYWLLIQDIDGSESYSSPFSIQVILEGEDSPEIVKTTALKKVYPNPFNPVTTIAYDIAEGGLVMIDIYNHKGQHTRSLVSEHKENRSYTVIWDGRDDNGRQSASGTYIIRMKAPSYDSTRKISLLK